MALGLGSCDARVNFTRASLVRTAAYGLREFTPSSMPSYLPKASIKNEIRTNSLATQPKTVALLAARDLGVVFRRSMIYDEIPAGSCLEMC